MDTAQQAKEIIKRIETGIKEKRSKDYFSNSPIDIKYEVESPLIDAMYALILDNNNLTWEMLFEYKALTRSLMAMISVPEIGKELGVQQRKAGKLLNSLFDFFDSLSGEDSFNSYQILKYRSATLVVKSESIFS